MYKITKRYENFDGVEVSEDFYFNMTEEQLISKTTANNGDFVTILKKILREKDGSNLIQYFRDLVLMSYGEKSADGKHFYKSAELAHSFECHAAFSEIYMELAQDDKKAAEFLKGILPKKYGDQINVDNINEEELMTLLEK